MTPKEAFLFMKKYRMDFKALMLLEQMSTYAEHIQINLVVMDASREKISSPATSYKYLGRLKRRKYVKDVWIPNQDRRCHYISITEAGKELLQQWSI